MKIIEDNNGYINSLLVLIILLPIFLIVILSVSLSFTLSDDSAGDVSTALLKTSTGDVESQLDIISKIAMHNMSKNSLDNRQILVNSTKTLKTMIQLAINNLTQKYHERGININCTIINVYPSTDPFSFDVYYRINSSYINNSSRHISRQNKLSVSITDAKYPVYDVYPLFKGNVTIVNNSYSYDSDDMAYQDAISGIVIRKCPYEDYKKHANSNLTMLDCLNNHYYHFSHDGLCVFCRLENKSSCSHNGLETFIVPTLRLNESTSSVDHVYFNETPSGHYNGSLRDFNESFIFLDDAHGGKYGF